MPSYQTRDGDDIADANQRAALNNPPPKIDELDRSNAPPAASAPAPNIAAPPVTRPGVDPSSAPSTIVIPGKIEMPQPQAGSSSDTTPSPANANSPNAPTIPPPLGARGPNGETVFSDGSGGTPRTISPDQMRNLSAATSAPSMSDVTSTMPRPTSSGTFNGQTLTADQLNRLANTNVVPSEYFTRPGIGTLGMPVSPEQGIQAAAQSIQRPNFQPQTSPGSYDPTQAAQRYRSDLADVLNKDPRSISGTAAHNVEADYIWNRNLAGSNVRKQNAADAIYQEKISALAGMPRGVFDAQNQAGDANARNQTQFADTTATNATNLLRTGFETNARLTGAEARADALRYGADRRADSTNYAADSRGNALRDVATTRANTPKVDSASTAAAGRIYQQAVQEGKSPD